MKNIYTKAYSHYDKWYDNSNGRVAGNGEGVFTSFFPTSLLQVVGAVGILLSVFGGAGLVGAVIGAWCFGVVGGRQQRREGFVDGWTESHSFYIGEKDGGDE